MSLSPTISLIITLGLRTPLRSVMEISTGSENNNSKTKIRKKMMTRIKKIKRRKRRKTKSMKTRKKIKMLKTLMLKMKKASHTMSTL